MSCELKHGLLISALLAAALNGFCADSGLGRVLPGVRRMAERLQRIVQAEDPMSNSFRNRERAAILEEAVRQVKNPGIIW